MAENVYRKRRRLAKEATKAAKPIGYVYFVGAEEVGRVKIGYTLFDPNGRFETLETGSPVKLSKLGLMRGSLAREAELHSRFKHHHARREWFHLDSEIVEFIAVEARDWKDLLWEEKVASELVRQEATARKIEAMQRQYQAINSPTSTDYMLGRL